MKSLSKREVKSLSAGIEKFDLEGSIHDCTFLPDELIEAGLPNLAGAVGGSVNAVIFAKSVAVQRHLEANGFTVLRWS